MARERQYQKERKKKIKITIVSVLLLVFIVTIITMFSGNTLTENSLEKFNATGTIPGTKSFIALSTSILNPQGQFYTFVPVPVTKTNYYVKTGESSSIYHHTVGAGTSAGLQCDVGEVVRFKFCTNQNSKSSCLVDIFDELWQIHEKGDYANFQDFYVDDMDFYFAYSCYEPYEIFPDTFERRFLYNGKCLSEEESNGKGEEFTTEKYCLNALEEQEEQQAIEEAERQEELRLDNLEEQCEDKGGTFKRSTEKCVISKPSDDEDEDDDSTVTDDGDGDTTIGLTEDDCADDEFFSEGLCYSYEDEVNPDVVDMSGSEDEDTNTSNLKYVESISESGKIVSCNAYAELTDGECKFSFSNLLSDKGFKAYWNDEPLNIVGAVFLLIVIIFVVLPTILKKKTKGGKKGK